jgi:putative FmdB family regulatory protein
MPLYEYHCTKCDERFARTEPMSQHGSRRPTCPKCSSRSVEPILSSFFAKTIRKS